jgi:predicted cupin superfamily sugar epimerase
LNAAAERLVRELALEQHPEGGYYREVFRSPQTVVTTNGDTRSALTVIYFLLAENQVSTWHRLRSDETWHFACGDEIEISLLEDAGHATTLIVGPSGPYVAAVPAGLPFAARVRSGTGFALVTCCVAPGFEFEDFEMLDVAGLLRAHPDCADMIASYVR